MKTATAVVEKKAKSDLNWMSILKNGGALLLGVLIGNVGGAAAGSMSPAAPLVGGVGFSGLGFVLLQKQSDKKWIGYFTIGFGAGMLTSPVVQVSASSVKGLNGLSALGADSKEGVSIAINNLATKFYLHKTPLAKYLPAAGSGAAGVDGLGNILSDEEAQKVIDSMLKEQKRINGTDDTVVDGLRGNLLHDYGMAGNGSLLDDLGDIELGDLNEEMGDLGIEGLKKVKNKFLRARKKFGKNHPKVAAYGKKHNLGDLADLDEMGMGRSLMQEYAA